MVARLLIAIVLAVAGAAAGVRANDLYANIPVTWINGRGIPLRSVGPYADAFEFGRREIPSLGPNATQLADRIRQRRTQVTTLWVICFACVAAAGFAVHGGLKTRANEQEAM